jgi:chromosome segregation ATPase
MDEKLEFFRTVVKQKEETLARARALYEQRDLESTRLREVAVALYAQAEEVLPLYGRLRELPAQLEQLNATLEAESRRAQVAEARAAQAEASLKATDADRRDLARALAEVEAELPGLRSNLEEERQSRAMLAEELVAVKESQARPRLLWPRPAPSARRCKRTWSP